MNKTTLKERTPEERSYSLLMKSRHMWKEELDHLGPHPSDWGNLNKAGKDAALTELQAKIGALTSRMRGTLGDSYDILREK
jgi:hypothetical protein